MSSVLRMRDRIKNDDVTNEISLFIRVLNEVQKKFQREIASKVLICKFVFMQKYLGNREQFPLRANIYC
jgi:hypothetical protein